MGSLQSEKNASALPHRPLAGSPQGLCHRSGGFQPSTPILAGPPAASLTISALVYLMLLLTSCGAKNILA